MGRDRVIPVAVEGRPAMPQAPAASPGHRLGLRALDATALSVISLFVAIWVFLGFYRILANDFSWHLRTGQIIWQSGSIPTTDLFTYTRAGGAWTNQAWLMQLLYYALYSSVGPAGVIFAHMGALTAGYYLVWRACARHSGRGPAALATLAAFLIGLSHTHIRPQTISFLLFGLLVWVLESARQGQHRRLWLLPPLFLLWANAHGGFLFGLGLLALAVLAEGLLAWRRRTLHPPLKLLLAVSLLSLLALTITPAGPRGLLDYVLGFLQSKATMQGNTEFQPLSLREVDGFFFFALSSAFLLVAYVRKVRPAPRHLLVLVVFGLLTLYARRIAPWYGMAAAPLFAGVLAGWGEGGQRLRRPLTPLLRAPLLGILLALALLQLPWLRPQFYGQPDGPALYLDAATTPMAATARICADREGVRLFNEIGYGSYLVWACPELPVFMDTRFELYPTEQWEEYMAIGEGRHDWQSLLQKYSVNTLMLSTEHQEELIRAARLAPAWEVWYEDEQTVILRTEASDSTIAP